MILAVIGSWSCNVSFFQTKMNTVDFPNFFLSTFSKTKGYKLTQEKPKIDEGK